MNIIETLERSFIYNDKYYSLSMHVTAWNKLCLCYREMVPSDSRGTRNILCSVCVEPENEPRKIENTIGYLNEGVGNAKTFDDAALMLKEYVEKTYLKK